MPLGSILTPGPIAIGDDEAVEPDLRKLLLVFRLAADGNAPARRRESLDAIRNRLDSLDFRLLGDDVPAVTATHVVQRSPAAAVNDSERYLWIEDEHGAAADEQRLQALLKAFGRSLDAVAPVFRSADGVTAALLPHVLLIEPRAGASASELGAVLHEAGASEDEARSRLLGALRYINLPHRRGRFDARLLRERLLSQHAALVRRVLYEQIPLLSPLAFLPDDALYHHQWNMPQVQAPNAWDVTRGAGVTVAIFDSGCQLDHPDLRFASAGLNVDDMSSDGSPVIDRAGVLLRHGTNVAGVIGGRIDNAVGVAGLAGEALLLPIATASHSDASIAMGIRYAAASGARVINMSFATSYFSFRSGPIPAAIEDAHAAGCVLCAAAGNGDSRGLLTPARHARVMAVGASVPTDERWSIVTSIGPFGSNYGDDFEAGEWTGVSVVAPGDNLPTTDFTGSGALHPVGSPLHGYTLNFLATSAATPHVAAAAALLLSRYPALAPGDVRRAIEQAAAKVGSHPYAYVDGFPSGTRNEYMGYGRLDVFAALRYADIFIRDWPGDRGEEPGAPPGGNFFSRSDIVIRPADDDVFMPDSPVASQLVAGSENFVYVRVTNRGPSIAHLVDVDVRLTPFVGLEFHFPDDWRRVDMLHIRPDPLTGPFTLDAGTSAIAKFRVRAEDADRVAGWEDARWHPCVLAVATALADSAFEPDRIDARHVVTRFNNLAQRNLSVIRTTSAPIEYLPFAFGHPANDDDEAELLIDVDPRLVGRVRLWLAGAPVRLPHAATHEDGTSAGDLARKGDDCGDGSAIFLDRARVVTTFGGCRGVLTLEPGSRFDCAQPTRSLRALRTVGGTIGANGARHWIDITAPSAWVRIARTPRRRQWLVLETRMPQLDAGDALDVQLRQRSAARTVGGAVVRYIV